VAGRETVKCRDCDQSHDVADLKAAMLAKVLDYCDTAQQITRILNSVDVPVKFKTLTSWADLGFVSFTETDAGRVYVVRDVLATYEARKR
jgi:hypothetical protein